MHMMSKRLMPWINKMHRPYFDANINLMVQLEAYIKKKPVQYINLRMNFVFISSLIPLSKYRRCTSKTTTAANINLM